MSQEKLAELCDVGTTHISHIETGNCVPCLKIFIKIINVLSCSADEILCDELMILTETLSSLKNSLRKKKIPKHRRSKIKIVEKHLLFSG